MLNQPPSPNSPIFEGELRVEQKACLLCLSFCHTKLETLRSSSGVVRDGDRRNVIDIELA